MKCPKCNKEGFKFKDKKLKAKTGAGHEWSKRPSSKKLCKACGYEEE
jgi:hypothetical protein